MVSKGYSDFKGSPIPPCFDDPEARLRYRLGQDAVPTLQGGRHVLYVCPVCHCPWYRAGTRDYPRLTQAQLAHLGATLHADLEAQHIWPRWLCPICSVGYLDGVLTIEEYRPRYPAPGIRAAQESDTSCWGYQFLWERASPPRTRMVVMVQCAGSLSLSWLLRQYPDILTASVRDVRSVLAWLERRPCPTAVRVFTDEERLALAHRLPPQEANRGSQDAQSWCGYGWQETGLLLGERALVALAVTTSPLEPVPFARLFMAWRFVARAMHTVL